MSETTPWHAGEKVDPIGIREVARGRWGGRLSKAMGTINARHPWSHNDHFHPWILPRLPAQRRRALDVGCGRGELLAALAPHFEDVGGIDVDTTMRESSAARCAGLGNVTVDGTPLHEVTGPVDLVTMVAVLHHLDLENALSQVVRVLAPGGRFLSVGLARPATLSDHAWDLASMITNPAIGYVKHPWVSPQGAQTPSVPVADSRLTYAEIGAAVERAMPGARMRHQLGFRHTIEWTKPQASARPPHQAADDTGEPSGTCLQPDHRGWSGCGAVRVWVWV